MNILVVRIGRLGDMVMILPALHAIRLLYPLANIYALTSVDGQRLLPLAGIDPSRILRYRPQLIYRYIESRRIKNFIAEQGFDRCYCFETKPRTLGLLPSNTIAMAPSPSLQHYAHRCLSMVLAPESIASPQQAYLSLPSIQHLHQAEAEKPRSKTLWLGLHPTYSGFGKWSKRSEHKHRLWPLASYAELAKAMNDYAHAHGIDLKIVMNLLPHEQAYGRQLEHMSQGTIQLLSSPPKFSSYLAYLQQLDILIVSNTGVMHLAAALNTSVVALFSDQDPGDCGPYMDKRRFKVLRAEETPYPFDGLKSIKVNQVMEATISLLKETRLG